MNTLTADPYKRVRIDRAEPGQVFVCTEYADGSILLKPIEAEAKEAFPPGSLRQYVTEESNAEMLQLLKGCSLEVPE